MNATYPAFMRSRLKYPKPAAERIDNLTASPVQLQLRRGLPGVRCNKEALACAYKGKNIVEPLGLTASQTLEVFEDVKIRKHLKVME